MDDGDNLLLSAAERARPPHRRRAETGPKQKDKLVELDLRCWPRRARTARPARTRQDSRQPSKSKERATQDRRESRRSRPPRPKPEVELVKPSELVLGSLTDKTAGGYRLEVQLEQKGAGIESVYSSRYDAELEDNGLAGQAVKRPLQLIGDHRSGRLRWRSP